MNIICEVGEWVAEMGLLEAVDGLLLYPGGPPQLDLRYSGLTGEDIDNLQKERHGATIREGARYSSLHHTDSGLSFRVVYYVDK